MASQAIYLSREGDQQRVAFWLDVPAALQPAFANPDTGSAFQGAAPAEVEALRLGTVREIVESYSSVGLTQTDTDARYVARAAQLQAELNATPMWAAYGRRFNGSTWAAGSTQPIPSRRLEATLPTFLILTPVSAFAASRYHLVLYNGTVNHKLRLLLLVAQPQVTVVTSVISSVWDLRRRVSPTTLPAGGSVVPVPLLSTDVMPAGVTCHNIPTTAPAGGTATLLYPYLPQADEIKLSTLDAPTWASLLPFGGSAIYDANRFRPALPIILLPGQTIELQQSATGGTGNCRLLAIVAIEDAR
jgi:hypothetical protein